MASVLVPASILVSPPVVFKPLHRILYVTLEQCKRFMRRDAVTVPTVDIFQQLHLDDVIRDFLAEHGTTHDEARNTVSVIKSILRQHGSLIESSSALPAVVEQLLSDFETADLLGVNQHNDIWYYRKEQFEMMMQWILTLRGLYHSRSAENDTSAEMRSQFVHVSEASARSEFKVELLKEMLLAKQSGKKAVKKNIKKVNSSVTKKAAKSSKGSKGISKTGRNVAKSKSVKNVTTRSNRKSGR